ncbi:MAG: DUF2064 domain-containing protein [SAR324 cluster bacterium]|nr:DUF2064 domain-containing protein [SAR324 cluster bacterium]
MSSDVLIVFVRYPRVGKVKTRMTKSEFSPSPLNIEQASILYYSFLKDLILRFQTAVYCAEGNFDLLVMLGGALPEEKEPFEKQFSLNPQQVELLPFGVEDLGKLMEQSFRDCAQKGYKKMVLIGSDVPQLKMEQIHQAFVHLDDVSMVIGPDNGGGMYLVGCSQPLGLMEEGIVWGQGIDREEVLKRCDEQSTTYQLLSEEIDMDTSEDLAFWYDGLHQFPGELESQKKDCPNTMLFLQQLFYDLRK